MSVEVSGFKLNSELWEHLRFCQKESIKVGLKYLRQKLGEGEKKSCLISLPTGAGKSGVISVLAHKASQKKILVLCHRRAVCNQLYKDISGKFFDERLENHSLALKKVFNSIDDISSNGIYVSTFQKLQTLNKEDLEALKSEFELLIIDEGHAEPSPVWKNLVRGAGAHKIVITATPYRNDLFQFDIKPDASYIYTFEKAQQDEILVEPHFYTVSPEELNNSIRQYIDAFPNTKCIVKCKSFSDIENYYESLNETFNVLAIHDQYKSTSDGRSNVKSTVPSNLKELDYEVIIHQRKLDEGVDIPQAKLLILTYTVNSGRELVQTIGRIVRLFNGVIPKVIELNNNPNERMWRNYRLFDRSLSHSRSVQKFISSLDTSFLLREYLKTFPDASYYENQFLSKFDFDAFEPTNSIVIPTASVCFINKRAEFDSLVLLDELYWLGEKEGELVKKYDLPYDFKLVLSVAFNKSRFLKNQFFFEPTLELTLFKELSDEVVAIYDSRGRRFSNSQDLMLGSSITQEDLLKMMSVSHKVTTKEASSRAINSTTRRPENVSVKGKDLEQSSSTQSNSAYRVANLKFDLENERDEKVGSYYIGVDAGRISDQKQSNFSLHELNDWLGSIISVLQSNQSTESRFVNSYAQPVKLVNDGHRINSLVLDLTNYEQPIVVDINNHQYELDNTFHYYLYDEGFLLIDGVDDSRIECVINFEESKVNFSANSEISYIDSRVTAPKDAVDLISDRLDKILLEHGVSFSNGRFFKVSLPSERGVNISDSYWSKIIIGIPELLNEELNEKGLSDGIIQVDGETFSDKSVFGLVDKLRNISNQDARVSDLGVFSNYISNTDLIICSDMGTEPADFIVSSPEKLIYVHVKCGKSRIRPESSAGALAEVGGQAIKNIEQLISNNTNLKAGNWRTLESDWPNVNAEQKLNERIRLLNGELFDSGGDQNLKEQKLAECWGIVTKRRRATYIDKEVWIVAANSFSKGHFEQQLANGNDGNAESLQAFQLIQSWLMSCNSLDVGLKIFVSD